MKQYILTGTPGCGKTTIIRTLEVNGYYIIDEAATDVIDYEQMLGIAEPWLEPDFIDKIIALQKQRQLQTENSTNLQFFDRSPFCTYALSIYLGYEPCAALLKEIERIQQNNVYERRVFFIENLGYCEPSPARQISFEQSLVFEKIHADVYSKFGYECITIPALTIAERMDVILSMV